MTLSGAAADKRLRFLLRFKSKLWFIYIMLSAGSAAGLDASIKAEVTK
jgi:hypothetical protein